MTEMSRQGNSVTSSPKSADSIECGCNFPAHFRTTAPKAVEYVQKTLM